MSSIEPFSIYGKKELKNAGQQIQRRNGTFLLQPVQPMLQSTSQKTSFWRIGKTRHWLRSSNQRYSDPFGESTNIGLHIIQTALPQRSYLFLSLRSCVTVSIPTPSSHCFAFFLVFYSLAYTRPLVILSIDCHTIHSSPSSQYLVCRGPF